MCKINNVNIVLSLLIDFVKNETEGKAVSITNNTNLYDIGLTGIKGIVFIKKFSAVFKVNIDHFNFEDLILSRTKSFVPLSIGHLEKAIVIGKLDQEIYKHH
jgi:hypothetical protein